MIRCFVYSCILLTTALSLFSQPHLSRAYLFGNSGLLPTSILVEDDSYLVASWGFTEQSDSVYYRFGIILHKIDFSGDTLWRKVYSKSGKSYSIGNYGSLAKVRGGYLLCGTEVDTITNDWNFFLTKFDKLGNSVWLKTYPKAGTQNCWHGSKTNDGGYIMIGETFFPGQDRNYYLLRTDSSGNKLWDKTYGGARHDIGQKIHQLSDGSYLISGTSESYGPGDLDLWFFETDSAGNKKWERTYGTFGEDRFRYISPSDDGGYIAWGLWDTTVYNTEDRFAALVMKLDENGDVMWRTFFNHRKKRVIRQLRELNDGSIVAIGEQQIGVNDSTAGWIAKLSSQGDVLWERFYFNGFYLKDPKFGINSYFRGDFQQTPDGGFVIAGIVFHLNDLGNIFFHHLWLVKLDSNGCFGPDSCGLEITPYTGIRDIPLNTESATIVAYPNPFVTQALISIKANSATFASKEIRFQLVDVSGKLLQSGSYSLNQYGYTEFYINRDNLPAGVYFYQVVSETGVLGTGKLVAE